MIENQFGDTDHDHLGKLLTYASALDSDPPVRSVIWISESFNDEHRSTLDWLNRISHDEIRFFGITVELLRIDGSRAAARFNLVASPNEWTKAVRASSSGKVSEAKRKYLQFWTALVEHLAVAVPRMKPRSPRPRAYFNFAIGRSKFALHCTLSEQKKQLGVALEIRGENSKNYLNQLELQKNAIEEMIGSPLDWRQTKGQACKISMVKPGDPIDESGRAGQIEWMAQTLDQFDNAFRDRVRGLTVED